MFAVTDLLQLGFVAEATPGVVPATPVFKLARLTGEGVKYNPTIDSSKELSATRMMPDASLVASAAGGPLNIELNWDANFNDIWQALFCTTWGTALGGASQPSGWVLGDTLWWGGTTFRYFTVEKRVTDTAGNNFYWRALGSEFVKASLNFSAGSLITGSVDVAARDLSADTAIVTGATYTAAGSAPIMRAPKFGGLKINGSASTTSFKSIKVDLDNKPRHLMALGSTGPKDVVLGRGEVKLSGELYFEDQTYFNYLLNQTTFSMEWAVTDDQGTPKTYKFYAPKLKMAKADVVAGGINQDLVVAFEANALNDATFKSQFAISR